MSFLSSLFTVFFDNILKLLDAKCQLYKHKLLRKVSNAAASVAVSLSNMFFLILAWIFMLIALGTYLESVLVYSGLGWLIVGGIIFLIALFVKAFLQNSIKHYFYRKSNEVWKESLFSSEKDQQY